MVANNAVYIDGGGTPISVPVEVTQAGNVTGTDVDAAIDLVGASFTGVPPNELFPAPGSALIGAADGAYATSADFNGTTRVGPHDVGAYAYDPAGNPGWEIEPDFKPLPEPSALVLLASGILALMALRSRRTRARKRGLDVVAPSTSQLDYL